HGDAEERAGLMRGTRWTRVFGPALAFALALQAVTGWCMASFYAPSSTTAWAAVAYIQQEVTLGWFIRGLHSAGASMTVALVALHVRGTRRASAWWPDDAWRDALACALVVALSYALVVRSHGAPLEGPADPASAYDARPEWYFLPLFQLLKYLPGRLETI